MQDLPFSYLGIQWSLHPSLGDVRREYERVVYALGSSSVEHIVTLPLMTEPASRATLDVLTVVVPAAQFVDPNFVALAMCKAVKLSLEKGSADGSCFSYVWLGIIAGLFFGDGVAGHRYGLMGLALIEKRGLTRLRARTLLAFGNHIAPWMKHARDGLNYLYQTFTAVLQTRATAAREIHLRAMRDHYEVLQAWTANSPEMFGTRSELVAAEIASAEGRGENISMFEVSNNEAGTWTSWPEKLAAIKAFYEPVCDLEITLSRTSLTPLFTPYDETTGSGTINRIDETWYQIHSPPWGAWPMSSSSLFLHLTIQRHRLSWASRLGTPKASGRRRYSAMRRTMFTWAAWTRAKPQLSSPAMN